MQFKQVLLIILFSIAGVSWGQDVGLVLRSGQINETALMEALLPPSTRPTKSPIPQAVRTSKPQAHMLMTFETNSAVLTPESQKMLDALARVMQADQLSTKSFAIEGHADPRGGEQSNLDLSQRRADAVVAYLSQSHSISASRLEAVGKGQKELLNPNDPFAPENRRVTVKTKVGE